MNEENASPLSIWLIAGEESGDQLGGKAMASLKLLLNQPLTFGGVGGYLMQEEGLSPLFPFEDIAVMGISAVLKRLPLLMLRVYQAVDAVMSANPDILVIIDSPDFTHAVAKRVRKKAPHIPIINYVSPSVWAWRPGRARKMRRYIDHVLALLPFEPAVHERLGGPPCTYVGHPLIERLEELRPAQPRSPLDLAKPAKILILPGSRHSEITRLLPIFKKTLELLKDKSARPFELVLPALDHLHNDIAKLVADWPVPVHIIRGREVKYQAFREADLALAASGTVTLELALSQVPMVVAYKVGKLEEQLKYVVKVPSMILANLILEENRIPEYFQWDCTPEKLCAGLISLLGETPERESQKKAFEDLEKRMVVQEGSPSLAAAKIIASHIPPSRISKAPIWNDGLSITS
jgi:lipid-A-disaccharide synthase